MKKTFSSDFAEGHIKKGHFFLLKTAAICLWKTEHLPVHIIQQILLAIKPAPCYRQLFLEQSQWRYVFDQETMIIYDDDHNDDDDMEYSDEELKRYYDGEWSEDEDVPYASGGLPASQKQPWGRA
ncbi:hypothetical protein JMJ35_005840 [Cladonia borealis]|uniref:Uncharacterized protein n=1 Tax=Cladonia borealis TaxID=184061 RepID=A0AA39QXW2_9LECA|nr:hypothetical protein JMJ35_005840 [Cladonia borealis]